MTCVLNSWPVALIGASGSGKTSMVRLLAELTNNKLLEFPMTASTDATELLGCFEQIDISRHYHIALKKFSYLVELLLSEAIIANISNNLSNFSIFNNIYN